MEANKALLAADGQLKRAKADEGLEETEEAPPPPLPAPPQSIEQGTEKEEPMPLSTGIRPEQVAEPQVDTHIQQALPNASCALPTALRTPPTALCAMPAALCALPAAL